MCPAHLGTLARMIRIEQSLGKTHVPLNRGAVTQPLPVPDTTLEAILCSGALNIVEAGEPAPNVSEAKPPTMFVLGREKGTSRFFRLSFEGRQPSKFWLCRRHLRPEIGPRALLLFPAGMETSAGGGGT